jgi:hypothetical protein
LLKLNNIKIIKNFSKNTVNFDAIFLYSVIYFTDWKNKLPELIFFLKKNGYIYINTNDLGWYLYNFYKKHNNVNDFNSKDMAIETMYNSINNQTSKGVYKQIITPKKNLIELLKKNKIKIIDSGSDGSCGNKKIKVKRFFIHKFKNINAVFEVLGRK